MWVVEGPQHRGLGPRPDGTREASGCPWCENGLQFPDVSSQPRPVCLPLLDVPVQAQTALEYDGSEAVSVHVQDDDPVHVSHPPMEVVGAQTVLVCPWTTWPPFEQLGGLESQLSPPLSDGRSDTLPHLPVPRAVTHRPGGQCPGHHLVLRPLPPLPVPVVVLLGGPESPDRLPHLGEKTSAFRVRVYHRTFPVPLGVPFHSPSGDRWGAVGTWTGRRAQGPSRGSH